MYFEPTRKEPSSAIPYLVLGLIYLLFTNDVGRVNYNPFNGLELAKLFYHSVGIICLLIGVMKNMIYLYRHGKRFSNQIR